MSNKFFPGMKAHRSTGLVVNNIFSLSRLYMGMTCLSN